MADGRHQPQQIRVFLSSPGDVADERALARRLLREELPYDPFLRGRVSFDVVSWDDPAAPIPADRTPQEAVNRFGPKPSECDVAIFILWSRLGTHLNVGRFLKPTGEPYLSGTEWEFEDAVQSRHKTTVLVYRRTEQLKLGVDDPDFAERLESYKRLNRFFDRFNSPDGSVRGGWSTYDTPTDFRDRLERDLKVLLAARLEQTRNSPAEVTTPAWLGSPYPGLRAFTVDEAAIFFGRGREVDALLSRLRDPAQRFLAVIGASGCGKSSLINAGLLPRLADGAIEGSQHWPVAAFTPGAVGDNPFIALASVLMRMLPPSTHRRRFAELGQALAESRSDLSNHVEALLVGRPLTAKLVLFVDQLEELLTLSAEEHRHAFIAFLTHATNDPRVLVLTTLRADFLPQCMAEPALTRLVQAGRFVLGPPGPAALADMIRKPADRAGIDFEDSLLDEILKDAGTDSGALPLVGFCLAELYQMSSPDHRLSLDAYHSLGGVRGAISRRVDILLEEFRETLNVDLDPILPELFRALVRVDATGRVTRGRVSRDAIISKPPPVPQLIEVLINGRLLLADDAGGRATVALAHDAFIHEWHALREWLERERNQMQRVHRLMLSLAAAEPEDRRYAVETLGGIGAATPEVVQALLATLGDASEDVCIAAADALAKVGPATPEVVPRLLDAVLGSSPTVRLRAAEAILRIWPLPSDALQAAVSVLADTVSGVHDRAGETLNVFGPEQREAVAALATALASPDADLRKHAGAALVRLGAVAPDLSPTLTSPESTLNYFRGIQDDRRFLNDAKLIVIGSGGAGKTSLVNRLVYNVFDLRERPTDGIRIVPWTVTLRSRESVCLRIWDFGGQEIMHATHQMFLTSSSIYLLVLDGRRNTEETDANYWLNLIELFAPDSPVIIALNKIKEQPFAMDRRGVQKKFGNVREFVETDCEDCTGIESLASAIRRQAEQLDHLRAPLPAKWVAIKDRLGGLKENYITFRCYQQICKEEGELDAQTQDTLVRYLHRTGIVLNFKDDPRLRDTHVLNPRWVSDGIFRLINHPMVAQNKGEVRINDLQTLLDEKNYPADRQEFLIELMKKFELCFRFADEDDRYLIPELLGKEEPVEAYTFTPNTCLNFEYIYETLPKGLMPRFIVRSHTLSSGRPRWRNGVILEFDANRALVRASQLQSNVQIMVAGSPAGRRQLLAVIRSDFEHIHRSYKTEPKQMVPAPSHPEISVPYRDLLVMERNGRDTYPVVVGDRVIDIGVKAMLDGVDLDGVRPATHGARTVGKQLRVFYSYSHRDEELRDELATHLKLFERRGLIQGWHDRRITAGTEWKGQIDENLESADVILLLISADFMASDYCYDVEMKRALDRHEARSARVVPIIISDLAWQSFAPFSHLQALPEDGRAVFSWGSNRHARAPAWRIVAEDLEKVFVELRGRSRT